MKKKFILLPITLTVLAPAISLVGCGDPDTQEEETKFTTTTGIISSTTEATFELNWENGHSLTFADDWQFSTTAGTVKSISATGGDTRPQVISISFSTEITEIAITDGKLEFTYNDLTTKKDNISVTLENICIAQEGYIVLNKWGDFDAGSEHVLYSEYLNLTAGSTFNFYADFGKWEFEVYPSTFEFFYVDDGWLEYKMCRFTLNSMYKNGDPVDDDLWTQQDVYVSLNDEFAEEICKTKAIITGEITLGEDLINAFVGFHCTST